MTNRIIALICVLLVAITADAEAAQSPDNTWTAKEMGVQKKDDIDPEGIRLKLDLLPGGGTSPAGFRCDGNPACKFELAYFLGAGFDANKKQRLNILFIAGGPGAIVDSDHRTAALRILERKHNIVYFHPRGAAQSAIDGNNEFDQFLRAGYVVDDVEQLRQAVLKDKPWDAIYGHSWGTVVAQRYAAKYGNAQAAGTKVNSLILSGPVDRHRSGSQGARTQATLENLKTIFTYYRSKGAASCQCQASSYLRPLVTDFSDPQISTFDSRLGASDNFCFLTDAAIDKIVKQLAVAIADMEENYVSADFIVDHFDALSKDAAFSARFGKYPIDFFAAVRALQGAGAPAPDALVFTADSRKRINAALLIAHALTVADPKRCSVKDELFHAAAADCEYCDRLKTAKLEQGDPRGGWESQRMRSVNGVYDGVARWLPSMMGEKGCFKAKQIATFANFTGPDKRFGRDEAKRIGIVADETICPWDPADFRHQVPALLLKGSRDTIVAGCQPEDFLVNGLQADRRVLLEFAGLGHDMSVANLFEGSDPSIWSKRFADLLTDFIKLSSRVTKFRSDPAIKAKMAKLKATDRTRDPSIAKRCGTNS